MTDQELADLTWNALTAAFPDSSCSLDTDRPERLAIRGILSAQCTDVRVNITSGILFDKYPEPAMLSSATESQIAEIIRPCGLYKAKAKSVKAFCTKLTCEWNGKIPNDVQMLMEVPGVGRKIANLIVGEIYRTPAIVVDTHCKRVMYRIGLTDRKEPEAVEKDLMKVFGRDKWITLGHMAVDLGRKYCTAGHPGCDICPLSSFCRRHIDG
ncbi:MAG: endonuclease III [Saccharofermentans sp.]|jgi:endonuclease-3|nr:endonuclease III [Mageeibacillus sp.]MCI1263608.1 endonuclease III [Saccharofermentans sp.]MCI1275485.1 endonuclease III [Saccharofermentans sp.]MCI1769381.1 endonuclease III [Mageeibacillus sp.]MCI2044486.1 endonuclease III [Mageeibacillus sp.]